MTPEDKGRHCSKCNKVVVDFTGMTDYHIVGYFREHSDICGRFHNFQLNREIEGPLLSNPWRQWIKKVAFTGFFLTKALTDKADTMTVPADSSIALQHWLQTPRSIHSVINQPETYVDSAISLKFKINDFHIFIPLDSFNNSFSIPDSIGKGTIYIELTTADSTHKFEIDSNSFEKYTTTSLQLVFNYRESWSCDIANFVFKAEPYIVMGIPPLYYDWKFKGIQSISSSYGFVVSVGDTVISDSGISGQHDSVKKIGKRIILQKRQSNPLWWMIPGLILLPFFGWQIRKKLKKTK